MRSWVCAQRALNRHSIWPYYFAIESNNYVIYSLAGKRAERIALITGLPPVVVAFVEVRRSAQS